MKLKERIKNNKILYFLAVLIVGLFLVLLVRIAYAYLAPDIAEGLSKSLNVQSSTVDEFKFTAGTPLTINATSTTLSEGGSNLTSVSKPKVTLKANNSTNTATKDYYVYVNIPSNTFVYTTDAHTPELILSITDPAGNPVTNISGLTYGTTYGVSGFDITTYSGYIKIYEPYSIESRSSATVTTQEWNITLTYMNLSSDQSANYGKTITPQIILQKEIYK